MSTSLPTLSQEHVGSFNGLNGVSVWGAARHISSDNQAGDTVYLSIVGPPTAVDVVWSRLMMNEKTLSASIDRRRIKILHEGIPGEVRKSKKHKTGKAPWLTIRKRLEGLEYDHLLFVDWRFVYPNYDAGVGASFMFEAATMPAIVGQRIRQLVDIPILDHWLPHLARLGWEHRLLKPALNSKGGHRVWCLSMDRQLWQTAISAALKEGRLGWDEPDIFNPDAIQRETMALITREPGPTISGGTPAKPVPARAVVPNKNSGTPIGAVRPVTASQSLEQADSQEPGVAAIHQVTGCDNLPYTYRHVYHSNKVRGIGTSVLFHQEQPSLRIQEVLSLAGFRLASPHYSPAKEYTHTEAIKPEHVKSLIRTGNIDRLPWQQSGSAADDDRDQKNTQTGTPYQVEHDGDWTWVSFDSKPSAAVIDSLKTNPLNMRWGKRRKAWYARRIISEERLSEALGYSPSDIDSHK